MKRIHCLALVLLALAPASGALAAAPAARAPAVEHPWQGMDVLGDPAWRSRFLGSYGFLSGAEPQIHAEERDLLVEVLALIKANPSAAAARLESQAGPDSSPALDFILANLRFQEGKLDDAESDYRRAIQKFPDFRRAHKNLGLLLVQKNQCPKALEHLSKAVELGDRDGRNYGLLGYCYLEGKNFLAAETAYRNAILQDPDTRDWKLGLARTLNALQRHKEAVALFDSLIAEKPDDTVAWLAQANSYVGLDRPMDAAVNLEAVRAMGKADTGSLVLLGDIYMNAGMPDLARGAYQEVIEKDAAGTQLSTAMRAAKLLVRTRAWGEAKPLLASIDQRYGKQLTPDDELEVLTLKAKVARAEGRDAEAAKLLESIVERDGTRGDALLELASYYHDQGDDERAFLLVEQAEHIDGFERDALLKDAQFRVAARDYPKAAELLRRALELKDEARVQRFLTRVEQAMH